MRSTALATTWSRVAFTSSRERQVAEDAPGAFVDRRERRPETGCDSGCRTSASPTRARLADESGAGRSVRIVAEGTSACRRITRGRRRRACARSSSAIRRLTVVTPVRRSCARQHRLVSLRTASRRRALDAPDRLWGTAREPVQIALPDGPRRRTPRSCSSTSADDGRELAFRRIATGATRTTSQPVCQALLGQFAFLRIYQHHIAGRRPLRSRCTLKRERRSARRGQRPNPPSRSSPGIRAAAAATRSPSIWADYRT